MAGGIVDGGVWSETAREHSKVDQYSTLYIIHLFKSIGTQSMSHSWTAGKRRDLMNTEDNIDPHTLQASSLATGR